MSKLAIPWPPLLEVAPDPTIECVRELLPRYKALHDTWSKHKEPLRKLRDQLEKLLAYASHDGDYPTRLKRCIEQQRISRLDAQEAEALIAQHSALLAQAQADWKKVEEVKEPLDRATAEAQSTLTSQAAAIYKRMVDSLADWLLPYCETPGEARHVVSGLFAVRSIERIPHRLLTTNDTASKAENLLRVWDELAPFYVEQTASHAPKKLTWPHPTKPR